MWPSFNQTWRKTVPMCNFIKLSHELRNKPPSVLVQSLVPTSQQIRTTYILRRKHKPYLVPIHKDPEDRHLKARHYIYEMVENTVSSRKPEPLKILLIKPAEGVGLPGDVVEMKPNRARNTLLLPKLGVYATKENLEKYSYLKSLNTGVDVPSSQYAKQTMHFLSLIVVGVSMNMDVPWVLEPWHVRVAFRKAGIIVPESALTLPSKPIMGPDLSIQGKEFYVTVQMNKKEMVDVRCRIHHVATDPKFRLPWVKDHWLYPAEPLFPEDREKLVELTKRQPNIIYHREDD